MIRYLRRLIEIPQPDEIEAEILIGVVQAQVNLWEQELQEIEQ